MPEQLMLSHALQMRDRRYDVPIAEVHSCGGDRQRARILEMNSPPGNRVHGCPIRSGDVDAEMKRTRSAGDSRIVEIAAHRMRPIERRQRPGIRHA